MYNERAALQILSLLSITYLLKDGGGSTKEFSRVEEFGPHLNIHLHDKDTLQLALEHIENNKESVTILCISLKVPVVTFLLRFFESKKLILDFSDLNFGAAVQID